MPRLLRLPSIRGWMQQPHPSLHRCRMASTAARVVMSGVQPTGTQHLGNYLGAIKQWVQQQNTAPDTQQTFFSVMGTCALSAIVAPALNLRNDRLTLHHRAARPLRAQG